MDKNHFIALLHRYAVSSPEEAKTVISLTSAYPYSQLLQALSARVSKDHQLTGQQQALERAAIQAADRSVLKEIINYRPEGQVSFLSSKKEEKIPGVDYADEVMRDLDRLNTLKHNFEMMFVEYTEVGSPPAEEKHPADPKTVEKEKTIKTKSSSKSKKERIIELAKAMQAAETGTEAGEKSQGIKKNKKDAEPLGASPADHLIEEIRASKQEIGVENEKQKEQIEIINQFIKIQPSISNAKDRATIAAGDLNPIKSGEFGDNIVSETLVEILIKQGKKDKAIEVLKKLIWKFPQKKSYFAAQIEDLKK